MKTFLEFANQIHPTIKFTADYSRTKVNFLDVEVSLKGGKISTDLYVKSTDTHQFLDFSSCHPDDCKTSIPFSQALRLNRICSDTSSFDKRCNDLESWLIKRGYDEKLVRRKVLEARRFRRDELLDREKRTKDPKITLNIAYHPSFKRLGQVIRKLHVILTFDEEHQNVFKDVPLVGFRKGKSLKDILVRAKVPPIENEAGGSESCSGKRCGVCPYIQNTSDFVDKDGKKYNIRKPKLNCNSSNVVYLLSCKACGIQYVGSCVTKFRLRFNNYKSCNDRHFHKMVPQQSLHSHFDLPGHSAFSDFQFTLIDQGENETCVRKRERFWQYKLNTFLPHGLNECEVSVPT